METIGLDDTLIAYSFAGVAVCCYVIIAWLAAGYIYRRVTRLKVQP